MTFQSSITTQIDLGNKRAVIGTFTNGSGDTGGDIATGLITCEQIFLQYTGASAIADSPTLNETLPCPGNAVTIITTDNADGIWLAIGH